MHNDSPINNSEHDYFNRKPFIDAIVNYIKNSSSSNSYVIGIHGKWGTGKTSVLNFLDARLKDEVYFTAYFNPWRYKSEEALLHDLFLNISQGVNSDKKLISNKEKLGGLLQEYSAFISLPKIDIYGIAFDASDAIKGLSKGFGKMLTGDNSLESKKKRINDVLAQIALPLIIFIDDVDRLDTEELRNLFKLIKLTADFNKLIYIVAFDEEIVAKSLAKNFEDGSLIAGKNYLEKIIQLPIRLPVVRSQEMVAYTVRLLNDWLETSKINLPDKYKDKFVDQFTRLHEQFIITPRDSKRLLNAVSFYHYSMNSELCTYDIILLETLRLFCPIVFKKLIEFRASLFHLRSNSNGYTIRKDLSEMGKRFETEISGHGFDTKPISYVIDFLFPFNDIYNVGYFTYQGDTIEDLTLFQRVGVKRYYDRYLEFKIGREDISDLRYKSIIQTFGTVEDFSNLWNEVCELKEIPQNLALSLLEATAKDSNGQCKINICKTIATQRHFFSEEDFAGRALNRSLRLTLKLLSELPEEISALVLKFTVSNCESVQHAACILYECRRGIGNNQQYKFEPLSTLERIIHEFLQTQLNNDISAFFMQVDLEKNNLLFLLFEDYGYVDQLKGKLEEFISEDGNNALRLIKSICSMTFVNFSSVGQYSTEIHESYFNAVERLIPREDLLNSLSKCFDLSMTDISQLDAIETVDAHIAGQYVLFTKRVVDDEIIEPET